MRKASSLFPSPVIAGRRDPAIQNNKVSLQFDALHSFSHDLHSIFIRSS